MNTNIRSTLSTAAALGLVSFITTSVLVSSIAAPATVAALGFLAVHGVVEIAIASYAGPRLIRRSSTRPDAAVTKGRAGAIIAFPAAAGQPLAQAA